MCYKLSMTKILRTQYKIWPIFSSGTLCISMQGRKRTEQLIEKREREREKPTQGIAVTILCIFRLWKEEPKGRSELRSEVDVGVVRWVRIIVLCIVAMDSDSSSRGKIQKTNKQNIMLMRKEIEVKEKKKDKRNTQVWDFRLHCWSSKEWTESEISWFRTATLYSFL